MEPPHLPLLPFLQTLRCVVVVQRSTLPQLVIDVIDLDQVIARVPAHNTPLNANDDSLAYFDAGEVDCDVEDTADEDTDPAMATDRSRWEAHEVMQLAWIRHDYDAQYRGQTRLQGQNRDVMLFEKLRERHPEFRHNLAAVKAKVFRMEAQYRRVGDLLLNASGKGRPPKLPIFYDIFDRILGDRANARPPALAGSLPGANVVNLPSTSTSAKIMSPRARRASLPVASRPARLVASRPSSPVPLRPLCLPARRVAPCPLPDRLATVRDTLILKHPSELTIEVLESALKDVKSNLHSVAPAFGAVPPPLFHGCTVPQLPTFTASLAATATDETAAAVSTSARSRVRSGRRGGQGAANSGGGGGGVASDGGGSAGVGGVPRAASSGSPVAASGGDARVRRHLQGCQLQVLGWRLGTWLSSSRSSHSSSGGSSRFSGTGKDRVRSVLRMAYRADGPAPDWLPLVLSHGPAQWDMSASQLLELSGTANAMYAVVDSSASDSICSLVFSLGASVDHVPVASVVVCVGASPGATLADASLSFMLDSSVSHCFFRDHMTLTPLLAPFSVALADPTSGPVIARHSTTLPCPAVPSGSLTGLHIPSFSRSLVGVQPLVSQHVGVWFEPFGDSATSVDGDTYAPLDTLL
ncbi:unnamed protein product [Closterium sp. NIES-54]